MYIAITLGWPHINIVFDIDPIFKGSFGKNDHPRAFALVSLTAICVLLKTYLMLLAYQVCIFFGDTLINIHSWHIQNVLGETNLETIFPSTLPTFLSITTTRKKQQPSVRKTPFRPHLFVFVHIMNVKQIIIATRCVQCISLIYGIFQAATKPLQYSSYRS